MAESIAVAATQAPPDSAFVPVVDEICYRAQLAARNQKLSSAVGATKVWGFIIGALFALAMVLVPLALLGGI
jgi:tetrahydromethanopterin S-methyltransferase F subunit